MKISKLVGKLAKTGIFIGSIGGIIYYNKKSFEKSGELLGRYKSYYQLANQWLVNKNECKDIESYFENNDIHKVAIYGMGTLGDLIYNDLKNTKINVEYFIDKNADALYYGDDNIVVVGLDDIEKQEYVDAIIVTPIFDFEEIEKILSQKTKVEIKSLEDVIYGLQ